LHNLNVLPGKVSASKHDDCAQYSSKGFTCLILDTELIFSVNRLAISLCRIQIFFRLELRNYPEHHDDQSSQNNDTSCQPEDTSRKSPTILGHVAVLYMRSGRVPDNGNPNGCS